ncbi:PIG-L family deacetylase [Streptomyces griseus]|uniref:PIG-L family deacetylase n=1 Tax=Streptomyces griseus TaxID=1911 RepID=UPI000840766F|nr:PIG-L family deacetylase [Streptomyces griseus]
MAKDTTGSRGARHGRRWPRAALVALCGALVFAPSADTSPASPGTASRAGGPDSAGHAGDTGEAGCRRTLVGVAHEDDDLLFTSPRVARLVERGCPVQVVYLTAGNEGHPVGTGSYAARREAGAQQAYARLARVTGRWTPDPLRVGRERIPSVRLRTGGGEIRLTFFRLPDGFPRGGGAPGSHESLLRLFRGEITAIRALDSSRRYDEDRLIAALVAVVEQWRTDDVLTLDHDYVRFGGPRVKGADHSDHGISARYFRRAAYASRVGPPVTPYLGYGISLLPANLDAGQRTVKSTGLVAYAETARCTPLHCPRAGAIIHTYRSWLAREYPRRQHAPARGEIVSDIGRAPARGTTELCLSADRGGSRVSTRPCDGSADRRWEFAADGTVRPAGSTRCLTGGPYVGLAACSGAAEQVWRRDGRGRVETGGRCLTQDDMARVAPRLHMGACSPYRPEIVWRW